MTNSLTTHKFLFPSGNRELLACIFSSHSADDGRPCILFVHGHGSSQGTYEQRARSVSQELNTICMTFDLGGHGDDAANFARYSVYEHLEDTVAAYDCLASQKGVDRTRIGVCGASYGGYLTALLTAHRTVKRLLLRAPALANDVHFPLRQSQAAIGAGVQDEFDSTKILARYSGEVLIVESEKDDVVPRSNILAYLAACSRSQHYVIPDALHALTNPVWDERFVKVLIRWFKDL